MVGKVLNERYKIIRELGKGGMALVYEAQDLLLDRKVAIKMLRPEYVNDHDFIKKFRHEAKAVARLSHPNVVSIFDIGQDDNYHYLVMEEIEGRNLKNIIKDRGKLNITESLDIVKQICSALMVAHNNNIIHCDIKPHNILITPDQQVKVTDFGIARAVTSSTITMTDTIMGSAHYFSPEQAKGGEIKAYSDLYSVGIVLYELLTGEVPFKGDSPISVALKHIQEKPTRPSLLNPDIPDEVEKIVLQALAKEPEARFNSAENMREAIINALSNLGRKKTVKSSVSVSDGDTMILKKTDLKLEELNLTEDKSRKYIQKENKSEGSSFNKIGIIISIVILGLVLSAFGLYYFYQNYMDVPVVEVPDLLGMELDEAQSVASQVGLNLEEQNEGVFHPEIPEGSIISQFPLAGERVRQTRPILVTLSKGPAIVTVPDLRGMSLREVKILLENMKVEIGNQEFIYNSEVPSNQIVEQNPGPDEPLQSGQKVDLVISKGEKPLMVTMPNLIGLTREEALEKIKTSKLNEGTITESLTKRFKIGQVASQQYQAGESVAANSTVNFVISKGLINTENAEIYTRKISYPVQGFEQQRIKIVVTDNNGQDVVYQANHQPGDRIVQVINSVGPTTYKIYRDGELVFERELGS